jgi:mandelamide amidase
MLQIARGEDRDRLVAMYRAAFRQHDIGAIVFPTEVLSPPPIRLAGDEPDETIEFNGRTVSKAFTLFRNTVPAAALGAPGLSLPAGLTRTGLPVALELDGLPGDDSILLSLALSVEAAIGKLSPPILARVRGGICSVVRRFDSA